jgi:hypothetical protein
VRDVRDLRLTESKKAKYHPIDRLLGFKIPTISACAGDICNAIK